MNARLYDPIVGRFISPDTIIPNAGNSQAYNRYTYVKNNPLSLVDPSGHGSLRKKIRKLARAYVKFQFAQGSVALGYMIGGPMGALKGAMIFKQANDAYNRGASIGDLLKSSSKGFAAMYVTQTASQYASSWGVPDAAMPTVQATANGVAAEIQGGKFRDAFGRSLKDNYGTAGLKGLLDLVIGPTWLRLEVGKVELSINANRYIASALVSGALKEDSQSFLGAAIEGAAAAIGSDASALYTEYQVRRLQYEVVAKTLSGFGNQSGESKSRLDLDVNLVAVAVVVDPQLHGVDYNAVARFGVRVGNANFTVTAGPLPENLTAPRYTPCHAPCLNGWQ